MICFPKFRFSDTIAQLNLPALQMCATRVSLNSF